MTASPPTPFADLLGRASPSGKVALGTAPLASVFWGNDEATAVATATRAIESGVQLFDTAPFYGLGESEARLGVALGASTAGSPGGSASPMVATKVGRILTDDGAGGRDAHFDFTSDGVRRSLESSLLRLGLDRIDLVHIHDPDDHVSEALAGAYPALVSWRDEGVIGAVSIGTNSVATAATFLERADLDAMLVAGRYSLLDQSAAPLIDSCATRAVAYLAAGVFNSGILARQSADTWYDYAPASETIRARVDRLATVCERFGVGLATAALHFALRHRQIAAVVVGMATPDEVDGNLAAATTPVPVGLWEELTEHGLIEATS